MLSPATLSRLMSQPVAEVGLSPFLSSDGKSGSHFLSVDINGRRRYILKRISRSWDWVMRTTGDHVCRPVIAWQEGLLERVPSVIAHGTVACAKDGDGWALLLEDFSDVMIPPGEAKLDEQEDTIFLDAMAALHAAFWDEPQAVDPARGFCDLCRRYECFSPRVIRPEAGGADLVPGLVLEGWQQFPSLVDPATSHLFDDLHQSAQPLVDALSRCPQTVAHGDWKLGNLGIIPPLAGGASARRSSVVLVDWALTGPAPPGADLAWYLALNSARLPVSKERCIELYRQSLSRRLGGRFDAEGWLPQLDLCLLGTFLLFGWEKALGAVRGETDAARARERAEIAWWSERASEGSRWM
jgi:hypothetical protein